MKIRDIFYIPIIATFAISNADYNFSMGRYEQALSEYNQMCEDGDYHGCVGVGFMYQQGLGTDVNITLSKQLYEKACNQSYIEGCVGLGYIYFFEMDFKNAFKIFDISCKKHHPISCAFLAYMYENKDMQKSIKFYKKSCESGFEFACEIYKNLN